MSSKLTNKDLSWLSFLVQMKVIGGNLYELVGMMGLADGYEPDKLTQRWVDEIEGYKKSSGYVKQALAWAESNRRHYLERRKCLRKNT